MAETQEKKDLDTINMREDQKKNDSSDDSSDSDRFVPQSSNKKEEKDDEDDEVFQQELLRLQFGGMGIPELSIAENLSKLASMKEIRTDFTEDGAKSGNRPGILRPLKRQ